MGCFLGPDQFSGKKKRAKLNFQGVPLAASILKERPFVPNVIRSRWLRTHGREEFGGKMGDRHNPPEGRRS